MKTVITILVVVLFLLTAGLLVWVNAQQAQQFTLEQQLCLERKARIEMQMQDLNRAYLANAEDWKKHGGTISEDGSKWDVKIKLQPETPAPKKK